MKSKFLALGLLTLALTACAGGSTPSKTLDSKIYGPDAEGKRDEKNAYSLPTFFFPEAEDVPYVTLKDFVEGVYDVILLEGGSEKRVKVEGNALVNLYNGAKMVFDAGKNEISCDDLDLFLSDVENDKIHSDIAMATVNPNARLVEEKSYRTAGKKIAWDMGEYYMKLVSHNGSVYVPYSVLHSLFLNKLSVALGFNGEDYYYNSMLNIPMYSNPKTGTLNEYGQAFYGGSMGQNYKRSESYSKYFYGSILFQFENFSGKAGDYALDDLDTTFEASGEKAKLMSSDSLEADTALARIITRHFTDGGHTGFRATGCTVTPDATRDYALIGDYSVQDTRTVMSEGTVKPKLKEFKAAAEATSTATVLLSDTKTTVNPLTQEQTSTTTILASKSGETAVISLGSFSLNADAKGMPVWATKENVSADKSSTFGVLYNSFEAIKNAGGVKNVVIDISLNGGGAAPALGEALGFLTNEDVPLTTYNPVTGARNVETMRYDTDLDGDFSDDDAPGADYNLYILTSLCSFSCGNAMPCIASDYGFAKIIGQRSGGGDCAVTYGCAVDGCSWSMSSTISIRHKDFTSVDRGAVVDASVPYPSFYDLAYLDTFCKSLASKSEAK